MPPKVSICIPTYKQVKFLTITLNSILSQTYDDYEIIITDDTPDNTIEQLLSIFNFKGRLKYFKNEIQLGSPRNWNRAIELASGEYIKILHHDDWFLEQDSLQKFVKMLDDNPEADFAFSSSIWNNSEKGDRFFWKPTLNQIKKLRKKPESLFPLNIVSTPSATIFRKKVKVIFNENLKWIVDMDFYFRVLCLNHKIVFNSEPLVEIIINSKHQVTADCQGKREVEIYEWVSLYRIIRSKTKFNYLNFKHLIFLFNNFKIKSPHDLEECGVKQKNFEIIAAIFFQWFYSIFSIPIKTLRICKEFGMKGVIIRIINKLLPAGTKRRMIIKDLFFRTKLYFCILRNKKIRKKFKTQVVLQPHKKNVLFIIPWMTVGGGDKVNLDLATHFNKDKYCIHFITTEKSSNEWSDKFKKITLNVFHLPEFFPGKTRDYYYTCIIEYLKVVKIDYLIISNSGIGYECLPFIKQNFPNIIILDILHGQGGEKEGGGFPKYSTNYDQWIDTRIVINNYLKNYIIDKYGINEKKVKVIYNGIDTVNLLHFKTEREFYKHKLGFSPNDFIITFIGRLSYEKHPEKVIEIANEVVNHKGFNNVKFVIAGDGDLKHEINNLITKYKLTTTVFLIGYVEDIPHLLLDSNALILTSEMEGLPLVILESMAMGVPVVASKVGGIPEIISDGSDSFLVEYDKDLEKNFTEKLILLMDNENLRKRFSIQAQEKIEKQFSMREMVYQYEQLLD